MVRKTICDELHHPKNFYTPVKMTFLPRPLAFYNYFFDVFDRNSVELLSNVLEK